MATVSVLVPTYHPIARQLEEALKSLQAQTFQDWTALVHDDCSADVDVRAIVEPFLSDTRIRFERSQTRLGIGGNWNACFRKSSEPVVAYLFQDDVWAPRYLESAMKVMNEHPTVGLVCMDHAYTVEGGMDIGPLYEAVRTFRAERLSEGFHRGAALLQWWVQEQLTPNVIGEPSFVVMRREFMKQAGEFLETMPQFLDTEYWTRMLSVSDAFVLRGEFGAFRVHPNGASAMNQESGQGIADRLRCLELIIGRTFGDKRSQAIAARKKAVEAMVAKYFRRRDGNKNVGAGDKSYIRGFCFRHPVLVIHAIVKYFAGASK